MEKILNQILSELASLKSQTSENTQILKALEHKSDIIKAEQENMSMSIAKLSGEVKAVKNDTQEIKENNSSINELLGEHEISIRTLRRRPV